MLIRGSQGLNTLKIFSLLGYKIKIAAILITLTSLVSSFELDEVEAGLSVNSNMSSSFDMDKVKTDLAIKTNESLTFDLDQVDPDLYLKSKRGFRFRPKIRLPKIRLPKITKTIRGTIRKTKIPVKKVIKKTLKNTKGILKSTKRIMKKTGKKIKGPRIKKGPSKTVLEAIKTKPLTVSRAKRWSKFAGKLGLQFGSDLAVSYIINGYLLKENSGPVNVIYQDGSASASETIELPEYCVHSHGEILDYYNEMTTNDILKEMTEISVHYEINGGFSSFYEEIGGNEIGSHYCTFDDDMWYVHGNALFHKNADQCYESSKKKYERKLMKSSLFRDHIKIRFVAFRCN